MLDPRILRDDPERVRASQRARGEDDGLVDAILDTDRSRRAAIVRFDTLRNEQKTLGRQVANATGDEKAALLARTKELSGEVKTAEAAQTAAASAYDELLGRLSNLVEEGVPSGGEDDYAVLEVVGKPPEFDFEPRDHLELGQLLGAIDIERGAKVSGARFYYLTGVGVLLQLAMMNLAMAQAVAAGFIPVIPPVLVKPEAMEGTGFLGQAAENVYRLPEEDLYLVGTSEVPLAAYHMDEVLDADRLPLRYAGWSTCFRREAGTYGKDTRGIIRVHQFDKIEMFSYCRPEDAKEEHRRLLAWEQEMLAKVEIPYRVIDVAAGDLGSSAVRKFDCEGWVPTQGRYRELTSASNCTEFQSRRLRERMRDEHGVRPLATLNGTLATTRWLVAILENHQQADGSVVVPPALRPFLGGREVLEPVPAG
ncbi:MAG: seryl-tRNA synthetase [Actinomycetota bacterium]|nr:seryl-tRNA synthetase [Actinomycetota bacterium]